VSPPVENGSAAGGTAASEQITFSGASIIPHERGPVNAQPGARVEIRDGLRLEVRRVLWPDATEMVTLHYRVRGPEGRWADSPRQIAFPARLGADVAAAIASAGSRVA
jgi:hypothetical protein